MKLLQTLLLATALVVPSVAQADFANGSSSSNGIPPSINQYYPLIPGITVASGASPLTSTARCAPFAPPGVPPGSIPLEHFDQLAMTVSTLGTGPITVALYTDAVDATTHKHQPQTLIASGSFTVTSAATVTTTLSPTPAAIPGGLDWVCVNDATVTDAVRFTGYTAASLNISVLIGSATAASVTSVGSNMTSITTPATSGTWPSFVGVAFSESLGATMPQISARIASVP